MTVPDRSHAWTKSSYSANTDSCVEVAVDTTVGIRDTKDRHGGQLAVPVAAWSVFTDAVKTDH
jgi:hypothetical protein